MTTNPAHSIPWGWNGPINTALRVQSAGPGHYANLSLAYAPSASAALAIHERAARAVARSLVAAGEPGPALTRFRRIAAENRQAQGRHDDLRRRIEDARRDQQEAGGDDSPGLAGRLTTLARSVRELGARLCDAREEIDALAPVLAHARTAAEGELREAAQQRMAQAAASLAQARREVEAELVRQIGDRLTEVLALDAAILRVRAGDSLRDMVRLLDEPLAEGGDGRDAVPPATP